MIFVLIGWIIIKATPKHVFWISWLPENPITCRHLFHLAMCYSESQSLVCCLPIKINKQYRPTYHARYVFFVFIFLSQRNFSGMFELGAPSTFILCSIHSSIFALGLHRDLFPFFGRLTFRCQFDLEESVTSQNTSNQLSILVSMYVLSDLSTVRPDHQWCVQRTTDSNHLTPMDMIDKRQEN